MGTNVRIEIKEFLDSIRVIRFHSCISVEIYLVGALGLEPVEYKIFKVK
jgi:hypothetical protein